MEKILVAEDERKLNDFVRDYLSSIGYEVIQSFNGADAIKRFGGECFDLAVFDRGLPVIDGLEAARRIRRKSDVPIILLTERDSDADLLLDCEICADDCLTKPISVRELGARVRALLRRCGYRRAVSERYETLTHGGIELDVSKRRVTKDGRNIVLTSAQFELLRILLQAPGRVFNRGELMKMVSGYDYEGYERTIDVHIRNLRKLLETNPDKPELLLTVWGVGYKAQE